MMIRISGLPAIGVLAAALLSFGQAPADVDVDAVVNATAEYVRKYQTQLTSVVAEETYTQQVVMRVPNDPSAPRLRRLTSEFFFMFAPAGEWMGIRDVIRVDGHEVKDRPVVLDELRRLPLQEVADTFLKHNSRFNVGRILRNFNEPTLVLHVLTDDHRSRFTFARKRVERRGNATLVTLAFSEVAGATSLIRDLTFGAALSKGELIVEAGTGRIHRALLTASTGPIRLELTTEFALEPRLEMWVPTRFRERYEHGTRPASLGSELEYEEISCDARYSNYRRFQTSGRIRK